MIEINDECALSPLTTEDAEAIFTILDGQREYMREWLPFVDSTKTVEDSRNAIVELTKGVDRVFTIRYRGETVGLIGLSSVSANDKIMEIGYWISQNAQHKGVITQSVVALLEVAFEQMEMNRVIIKAAVGNTKSRKIPEKLNFILEGVEREGELMASGAYADIAVYSMLRKEYIKDKK